MQNYLAFIFAFSACQKFVGVSIIHKISLFRGS